MNRREGAQQADVNSLQYWDYRFQHDWEARGGRDQSRFFAHADVGSSAELAPVEHTATPTQHLRLGLRAR